jgi:two-component system, OmpR family, sensor kinase
MSLRLRLTLIYTGLLSGVVLLLSIVIYSMVSVVMIDQVDERLAFVSEQIIKDLRADGIGGVDIALGNLPLSENYFFQVWSPDDQLLVNSSSAEEFTRPMNEQALLGDRPVYRDVEIGETAFRVLSIPLKVREADVGNLQVGVTQTDLRLTQRMLLLVFGISAVFSLIVAAIVGWLVTGQALQPLELMAQITNRITSTDDLSRRIPVSTGRDDEIGALVLTFNQTLVRLERLFNAQRRFLADVSHELRTPLTVIKGNVGLMRIMHAFDEESLDSIESEVDRLTRLVGDLLLMAQAESGRLPLLLQPVEMDDLLFEIFEQMKVLSKGAHEIRIGNIEPALVTGDRDRLKQVLLNLGSNAIKFSPEGGLILLSLYIRGDWVQILVSDEGPGIPKSEINQLFERFYRGDKSRSRSEKDVGFGLGLPIAYWILRNHGGRIDVETVPGKGTTFSVWLPLSQAEIPTRPLREMRERKNIQDNPSV